MSSLDFWLGWEPITHATGIHPFVAQQSIASGLPTREPTTPEERPREEELRKTLLPVATLTPNHRLDDWSKKLFRAGKSQS
jgi:hypothetical protein